MIELRCFFCGQPVDSRRSSYRRITGWERKALSESRKSGSDIVLREALDDYAHPGCIARVKAGLNAGQESLL
jgi:hypothetical protein